jgi:hypothetical protein
MYVWHSAAAAAAATTTTTTTNWADDRTSEYEKD